MHPSTASRFPPLELPQPDLQTLLDAGIKAYQANQVEKSCTLLEQAERLAQGLGAARSADKARFWHGAALHSAGRLTQAHGLLVKAFQDSAGRPRGDGSYMAMTRHLLIGQELPLPLARLEAALNDVEIRVGKRRSRLLLVRARLALDRGLYEEAFDGAEAALKAADSEQETFSITAYMRTLIAAGLALGRHQQVRDLLRTWQTAVSSCPHVIHNRAFYACCLANFARHEGRLEEAQVWAKLAILDAAETEDVFIRYYAWLAMARAAIYGDAPEQAREALGALLALRQSEIGEQRFTVRLMVGDYHLARARTLSGLAMIDPETTLAHRALGVRKASAAARSHLAKAQRHFDAALAIGLRLDALLECDRHRCDIDERMAILQSLPAVDGPG